MNQRQPTNQKRLRANQHPLPAYQQSQPVRELTDKQVQQVVGSHHPQTDPSGPP